MEQAGKSISEKVVIVISLLLLLLGLASSVYLTDLYVRVEGGLQPDVDSFCVINQRYNCVTVACCDYSILFGIPISVWGIEFYLLCLAFLLLPQIKSFPLKRWDSYLFILSALSLPGCAALAYISIFIIDSVCPLCCVVYAVNLLIFLMLGFLRRWRIIDLLSSGPKEFYSALLSKKSVVLLFFLLISVGCSQFFWMPPLFSYSDGESVTFQGMPVEGRSLGHKDAPIKIEEFTDFECPYCAKAHYVIKKLVKNHPDKIYLQVRNYPMDHACNPHILRRFHANACRAAKYAACAMEQDLYHSYQELLWANRRSLDKENLESFVEEAGLNRTSFNLCLSSSRPLDLIKEDIKEADRRGGIQGTPVFWVNGKKVIGLRRLEFWEKLVEELLAKQQAQQTAAAGEQ